MATKRLTAADVAGKTFTPVRLREGYAMDEVDDFLDAVVQTLLEEEREAGVPYAKHQTLEAAHSRTLQELEDSQAKVTELSDTVAKLSKDLDEASQSELAKAHEELQGQLASAETRLESEGKLLANLEEQVSLIEQTRTGELSGPEASVGLLRLTAGKRKLMLQAAEDEAQEIIEHAQSEREKLVTEFKRQAELEAEEVLKTRTQALQELQEDKLRLRQEVEELKGAKRLALQELQHFHEERLRELSSRGGS